jgi:hypothetical protein
MAVKVVAVGEVIAGVGAGQVLRCAESKTNQQVADHL